MKSLLRAPRVGGEGGPDSKSRPIVRALTSPWSIILIALLVGWPEFVSAIDYNYLVFSLTAAVPIAILGLGLLVLQGWTREISLVSAGLFAMTAYYFNWLNRVDQGQDWLWIFAAITAIAVPTLLMAGLALASSKLPPMYMIVLTIGLQLTIEQTVYTVGYLSGGTSGGNGGMPLQDPPPEPLGIDLQNDTVFYFFALFWLAVVLGLLVRLRRSPTGLAFMLVGSNRQSAAAVGIPAARFRVMAYVTAGFLAGVAGVLGSMLYISPPLYLSFGVEESMLLLCIPVLAGVDSMASVLLVASYLVVTPVRSNGGMSSRTSSPPSRWRSARCSAPAASAGGCRTWNAAAAWAPARRACGARRWPPWCCASRRAWPTSTPWCSPPPNAPSAWRRSRPGCPRTPTPNSRCAPATSACPSATIHALRGASIVVPTGQMVGLIGPNGAGKTTLFDVISGFTKLELRHASSCSARTSPSEPPWDRSRLGMARTFQNTRVIPELTGADNICAGAYQAVKAHPARFLAGDAGIARRSARLPRRSMPRRAASSAPICWRRSCSTSSDSISL